MRSSTWILCVALGGCAAPSASVGNNVVLVTLDTVRADHLGTYGYRDARTPEIDRLASKGVVFETAISVAPLTMPTHSSIMTGRYPYHHGVRDNGSFALEPAAQTLAEQLQGAGYDTGAVVSAMVLDSKFGLDQGFRVYDDDLYAGDPQKMFMFKEVRADVSVDKALKLMEDELTEPFFLWLHLFDAHADYTPPPPYDVLFLDQPYDGEIAYLDSQLGRLFDGIKDQKREDRTVVAITADHGDSLGEHGEQTHGIFIYRSTTHIPLVIAGPGIAPARVKDLVSQVDIAPTLTDLVGVPTLGTDGVSLYKTLTRGRPVAHRDGVYLESLNPRFQFGWHELRGIDAGTSKYIDAPQPELYDLTADPTERTNLLPAGATPLAATLDRWVATDDLDALEPDALDDETRKMLEELGYIGDLGPATAERPDPKDVAYRWVELQLCHALVRASRHAEAAECLIALLATDPGHIAASLSLAGVHRRMGRADLSLAVLRTLLEKYPTHTDALMSLGQTLVSSGDAAGAEKAFKAASDSKPTDPQPWVQLGELYQSTERSTDAVRAYSEALKRDEILVDAYVGLGNTFHRQGDSARALKYLQRAAELEPNNMVAWYNLGVVHDALGHSSDAEIAYKRALEINPDHAMGHNNLGSLYQRLGRLSEAESHFRRALEADPTHIEAKYNLATLLLDREPKTSVALLVDVVEARPDLVPARQNLAIAYLRIEQPDDAIAQYTWLAENTKAPAGAWLAIASIEARRGKTARARELVRDAITAGGEEARKHALKDPSLAPFAG